MSRSRSRSRGRRRKTTSSSSKVSSNHKKKSRKDEEERSCDKSRRKDKKVSRDNLSDCSTASRPLLHRAEQSQVRLLPFLIINYYQHTISIL